MSPNYRKLLLSRPYDPTAVVVPVTLTDGTQGYLPARAFPKTSLAQAHGLVCRRPLRHRTTARQTLVARGDLWQVCRLDGSTDGLPQLQCTEEIKVWSAEYTRTGGDLAAATAATNRYYEEKWKRKDQEAMAARAAQSEAAAALGLQPWHEADPFYREVAQQLFRWTAGRSLQDCRDVILVGDYFLRRNDFTKHKEKILALGLEIIAVEGFHRPMK